MKMAEMTVFVAYDIFCMQNAQPANEMHFVGEMYTKYFNNKNHYQLLEIATISSI